MLKKLVLLFSFALCLGMAGTCYGATLELQEQELQTLIANSNRLSEINSILQMNSTDSHKTLLLVSAELTKSQAELATLKQELVMLQETLRQVKNLSQSQQELLKKTTESFQTYSKEMNSKINSLRRDRTLLEVIIGGAIVYEVTQLAKK